MGVAVLASSYVWGISQARDWLSWLESMPSEPQQVNAGVERQANIVINNLLYTASAQAHRATLSYATRLLSRIESCPGYTGEEEVVVIGSFPTDRIYASIESYALVDHYSVPMDTVAPLNKHIYYYLNDWLNVPLEEPDEETMKSVSQSAAFRRMPLYPADGSVQRIDGRIVVKIQEEYTPKSDYELAYENRS